MMNISPEDRLSIFDLAMGGCYYCRKQLAYSNYGIVGARGGWELDHKIPKSQGGSDEPDNLVAACVPCNRDKSDRSAISYRRSTKSFRTERRNAAITGDLRDLAVPLSTMTVFGLWRLREWWAERKEREPRKPAGSFALQDLPWDAIIPLALVVFVIVMVVRSHPRS